MTTKEEMIKIIKAENPSLMIGDDVMGYTELIGDEYDTIISEWAQGRLDKEVKLKKAESLAQAKVDAIEKLTALGIDPKAMGLVIEEKIVKKQ